MLRFAYGMMAILPRVMSVYMGLSQHMTIKPNLVCLAILLSLFLTAGQYL